MKALNTPSIMRLVLLALVPGTLCMLPWFGMALLLQLALAASLGLAVEAACLALRHAPLLRHLSDGSALVSALLIALCLPPGVPWHVLAIAILAGLGLGQARLWRARKQCLEPRHGWLCGGAGGLSR